MTVNLSKIEKIYKGAISEIPENRLKELYDQLWYQAYHSEFIKRNLNERDKALSLIKTLNNENEPWKAYRASREAKVFAPLEVLVELYNKNLQEKRDLWALIYLIYLLGLASESEFLNALIKRIDGGVDPKSSLEFVKDMLVKVRDKTIELSVIHENDLDWLIEYLESKEDLASYEQEGIKKLKEMKGNEGFKND